MAHEPGRSVYSPPQEAQCILDDADPAGDLVLELSTNKTGKTFRSSIRVSSKVLSLSSPVFAAMLRPNFAEGLALQKASPQSIPLLSLPDDNPEAITWLCKAIHFKQDLGVDIEFSLLKELAVLCDKYDLGGARNPWTHGWLQKWPGSSQGVDNHAEILWISYALGSDKHFWRNSRSLIQCYTSNNLAAFEGKPWPVLPEGVFGKDPVPTFGINDIPCNF